MKKKTVRGYLLIAVDGSFATLPDHPVLGMIYGRRSGNINKETGEISYGPPQAKISLAYDVLNKVVLDFQVVHQNTSEIPLLLIEREQKSPTNNSVKMHVMHWAGHIYELKIPRFCTL